MSFNKKIIHAFVIISVLFLSLVIYLTYFQVFRAPKLANDGSNPRTILNEQKIKRGDIISSDGEVLATSHMSEEGQERAYPYDNLYSHIVGYSSTKYGRSGIENSFNGYIMGTSYSGGIESIRQLLYGEEKRGADIELTIDHELQKLSYELLGDRQGSIIAIEPKSGAVRAMVSKPDFNPNESSLREKWEELSASGNSPFLPRATAGLYPPGSSFKILTAAAAVEEGISEKTFEDNGSVIISGYEFVNYDGKSIGTCNIDTAFAKSSNVVFTLLADEIGRGKMQDIAERFMIFDKIDTDFSIAMGKGFNSTEKTNTAASGMGQGDLLVTPMHMALSGCAIANGGKIMKPYVVQNATTASGASVYTHREATLSKAIDKEVAERVSKMMEKCVESGTGTGAAVSGIKVAGKTGTAENEGEDHAWFVAFAPLENPEIVVCAMVENAGNTGGAVCAPMVREIISKWCKK